MRTLVALLVATAAFLVLGAGTALAQGKGQSGDRGNACPPASQNPGGTPPNCGHPPEQPPEEECVEEGPVSSIVDEIEQGIREGGGGALADVIHQVNCGIVVPLENALGLGPETQGL